jgi:hypothetical protein
MSDVRINPRRKDIRSSGVLRRVDVAGATYRSHLPKFKKL